VTYFEELFLLFLSAPSVYIIQIDLKQKTCVTRMESRCKLSY